MEKLFLGHTYAWLKSKGVLLMVIPCNAVYDVADTLSTRFTDIAIYRLVGEESEKYNQCAIFGVRHNNNGNDTVRWRQNIHRMMYTPRSLPVLTPEVDRMYSVPPNGNVEIYYTGLPLDEIEDRLVTSNAWKHAVPLLLPKQEVAEGHPLTPLHGGHVGLLTTAGMLNGKIRNAPDPDAHLAHWRPIKHTTTTVEYEDNIEITRTRERFSNEVAIVFVDGRTQILTETKQDEPEVEDGEDSETPEDAAAGAEFEGDNEEADDDDQDDEADDENLVDVERLNSPGSCKLFQLGRLTMSRGVQALVVDGFDLGHLLARYKRGEWGDTDQEDIDANNRAVMHDARIFSSYEVPKSPDGRIWIITEHDRSSTNVILPSEY
jgi:hypothetical protein